MLRLDYEALADSSRTLIEQGDIFEECIERMTQVIDALPDIWEAETCDRYVEQFAESKPTLNEVRNMIQEMPDVKCGKESPIPSAGICRWDANPRRKEACNGSEW